MRASLQTVCSKMRWRILSSLLYIVTGGVLCYLSFEQWEEPTPVYQISFRPVIVRTLFPNLDEWEFERVYIYVIHRLNVHIEYFGCVIMWSSGIAYIHNRLSFMNIVSRWVYYWLLFLLAGNMSIEIPWMLLGISVASCKLSSSIVHWIIQFGIFIILIIPIFILTSELAEPIIPLVFCGFLTTLHMMLYTNQIIHLHKPTLRTALYSRTFHHCLLLILRMSISSIALAGRWT